MTEPKEPSFFARLLEALAPKENRLIAAVSFVRTFGQGLTGSAYIGAGGTLFFTVTDILKADWQIILIATGLVVGSALISAFKAWTDVLQNGLNRKYAEAVVAQVTANDDDAALPPAIQQAIKDAA